MADRVCRIIAAASPVPSTMDGSSMVCMERWKSTNGLSYPDAGNQPRFTDTSRISMIPSQKFGTESPDSATMFAIQSAHVPLRTAETIPIGIPISSAQIIDMTASCSVTGSF